LALCSVLVFQNDINLVLKNNNVFQLHDIDSDQVLTSLRLRVRVVSCDEEQGCVHDCSTSKHSGHEGIVTGTIDKRDVSYKHEVRGATLIRALDFI